MANDTMSSMMSMPGTFTDWNVMQTHLLFRSYNIQEPYQFVLTWFMVMFAVVVNYIMRHVLIAMDRGMISALKSVRNETPIDSKTKSDVYETVHVHGMDGVFVERPKGWQTLKLIHSTIAAFNYGLSLMLMLVAMTFIPSLFLALFIGGVVGEYVCVDFHIDLLMGVYEPKEVYDGAFGGLVHWVLCSKNRRDASIEEPVVREKMKFEFSTWAKLSSWLAPRIISLILLIVTIVWVYQAEGTFGFESNSVFGWHALCMILFVGVFSNEALLTYTVPLFPQLAYNRKYLRMFHTSFHILSLAAIILGLVAIVDFKKWRGMDLYNFQVMWSGHSWMGALTVALWGLQFIFSVWMHAIAKWPEGTEDTKAFYNEIHKFVGYCVYAVGLASCASGFQDMQGSDYAGFQSDAAAAMLANPDMTLAQMIEMSTPGLGNELASVGSILLIALGISTFAVLKFYPVKDTA